MTVTLAKSNPSDLAGPRLVLWTGGFDSTFRVCYLLLVERIDVQPIYVIDPDRRSTFLELRAMAAIRDKLRERGGARLWPTRIYNRSDYCVPPYLQRLYEAIKARANIGEQYLWLAAIAEAEGWEGVELGEQGPPEVTDWHKIVFKNPPYSDELSSLPEAQLFKYWKFPLLNWSKKDMYEEAVRRGFDDILIMRWFCHRPILGRACGTCGPCRIARRAKMDKGITFAPLPIRLALQSLYTVKRLFR